MKLVQANECKTRLNMITADKTIFFIIKIFCRVIFGFNKNIKRLINSKKQWNRLGGLLKKKRVFWFVQTPSFL